MKRRFKIEKGLTLIEYEKRVKSFTNNPSSLNTIGGECMKFVRLLLEEFGFGLEPKGMDAWEFFAGLLATPRIGLRLVPKKWDLNTLSNADLKKIGVEEGSVIFGYYLASTHMKQSFDSNVKAGNTKGRKIIQEQRFKSLDTAKSGYFPTENVCTHVAYYLNGQMTHIMTGVNLTFQPTQSFRIIGWLPIDKLVKSKFAAIKKGEEATKKDKDDISTKSFNELTINIKKIYKLKDAFGVGDVPLFKSFKGYTDDDEEGAVKSLTKWITQENQQKLIKSLTDGDNKEFSRDLKTLKEKTTTTKGVVTFQVLVKRVGGPTPRDINSDF